MNRREAILGTIGAAVGVTLPECTTQITMPSANYYVVWQNMSSRYQEYFERHAAIAEAELWDTTHPADKTFGIPYWVK